MREEDFYIEQYFGDDVEFLTDAPLWERQALPEKRRNMKHKDRYMNPLTAKVRLCEYFAVERLPPAYVVAAVRRQSWKDLEDAGGSLDAVGDRLYVLYFLSMCSKLSYVKVGQAENGQTESRGITKQVRKRISAHEGEAKIAQAVLFDAWISRPCPSAVSWEDRVKAHLQAMAAADIDLGMQVKAEYFRGISFQDAVWVARRHEDPSGTAHS
ncbi:hypothetical protein OG473_38595 [Streptomyces anulatus]|uniref:hypothetical protein n=1 Tax=Streptomyces anulatus TaxID=1892 RepID=UPI00324F3C2A